MTEPLRPGAVYAEITSRTGGIRRSASAAGLGDPNRCLAVLFSCDEVLDPEHGFFAPLRTGIRTRALDRNADVFLCFPRRGSPIGAGAEAVDRCLRRGTDGIVVLGPIADEAAVAARAARIPIVCVEDHLGRGAGFVGVDNVEAVRGVVRHLAGLGHRRIAHISGGPDTAPGRKREEGFRLEMERLHLPVLPGHVQRGDFFPVSGYEGMRHLLELDQVPEAVVAASDMQAVGALAALEEAGICCPDDIAVTGFDDASFAARLQPALTTVSQEPFELGFDLVDALIEMIVYRDRPAPRILRSGRLVVRESCGGDPRPLAATG